MKAQRLHVDPIMAVWKMKLEPQMGNAIQQVGKDPSLFIFGLTLKCMFTIIFCSLEYAKISIEATGGIVKRLIKGQMIKAVIFY